MRIALDMNHAADAISIALCPGQPDAEPVIAIAAIIAIQICRAIIGGDQKVQVAVTVEIRIGRPSPDDGAIEGGAHRGCHVPEMATPKIAKQQRRQGQRQAELLNSLLCVAGFS